MNKFDHLDSSSFQTHSYLQEDLDFLLELALINSTTDKFENVSKVLKLVEGRLRSLGFEIQYISSVENPKQKLLYATRLGDRGAPTFTFVSHADTVFPASPIENKDGWLWGSGVADNKGGIVCALRTIALLDQVIRPPIHFVCACSEETGSIGFHHFFQQIGAISDYVLGFEPATKEGHFISERNGNRWYEVNIKGIPSHAGRFGEPALNASHEAALKISQWILLNDENNKMKLNVGSIEGGNGLFNVVCGEVKLRLDMRFPSKEHRDEMHDRLINILHTAYLRCNETGRESQSDYVIKDDCPPMSKSKNTEVLNDLARTISDIEGIDCQHGHSGGAADCNYFAHPNNICIDGLGPIAIGMHTPGERLYIKSLETRPYALAILINNLLKNNFLRGAIDEREFIKSNSMEN